MADDLFTAHLRAGERAAAGRDWDAAARNFRSAVEVQPSSAVAHRNLAAALQALGLLDDAEAACRTSISLDPESAGAHFNLGSILLVKKDLAGGEASLHRVLALRPDHAEAAYNLGSLAVIRKDGSAAHNYFKRALAANPTHRNAAFALARILINNRLFGEAADVLTGVLDKLRGQPGSPPKFRHALLELAATSYKGLGDLARAAVCYREILVLHPDDPVAQHLLAAAEGATSEAHVRAYAKTIFDNGAEEFTNFLVEGLKYRAPEIIAGLLERYKEGRPALVNVVDLGCGTGLVGAALVSCFKPERLTGVDLSDKMIAEARSRNIYTELVQAELVTYLEGLPDSACDLITAADVFIYVGGLTDVFAQARRVLAQGGLFAFCTEITTTSDVELAPSGRYRHNKSYIRRLAADSGFAVVHESDEPLRLENHQQVYGQYCLLRSS